MCTRRTADGSRKSARHEEIRDAAVQAIRPDQEVLTRQRLPYFVGISAQTVGASGLSMHLVVIPPGGRSEPHSHLDYETGIYVLEGTVRTRWGAALEHEVVSRAGDFLFIPPGMPHEAINLSATEPARAVVARNDPRRAGPGRALFADGGRGRLMAPPLPFVRDAGSGPGVVCLHSNASSSSQWRGLMELLAPRFRVLAPDSYGAGKSPEWPSDRQIRLADEVALIEPVLHDAGSPLTLVGHSYGAAIALRAALDRPAARSPPGAVRADPVLARRRRGAAAERRRRHPPGGGRRRARPRRAAIAIGPPRRSSTTGWAKAPGSGCPSRDASRSPPRPSTFAAGPTRSSPSRRRCRRFARWTCRCCSWSAERRPSRPAAWRASSSTALPRVEVLEFAELGHMGPVTHPERVNAAIARFLEDA